MNCFPCCSVPAVDDAGERRVPGKIVEAGKELAPLAVAPTRVSEPTPKPGELLFVCLLLLQAYIKHVLVSNGFLRL